MDKFTYNNQNYPQVPPQMSGETARYDEQEQHMLPAPPSYEQATGASSTNDVGNPPVHVLPTPRNVDANSNPRSQSPRMDAAQAQPHYQPHPQAEYASGWVGAAPQHATCYHSGQHGVPPPMMQQPQATPIVIIQQQTVLPLGPEPAYVTCPACHVQKLTRIEFEPSARTHLMAALLCVLGLWCCVCLPYCAGSCMNTNHYCGNCNKFLGTYGNTL